MQLPTYHVPLLKFTEKDKHKKSIRLFYGIAASDLSNMDRLYKIKSDAEPAKLKTMEIIIKRTPCYFSHEDLVFHFISGIKSYIPESVCFL